MILLNWKSLGSGRAAAMDCLSEASSLVSGLPYFASDAARISWLVTTLFIFLSVVASACSMRCAYFASMASWILGSRFSRGSSLLVSVVSGGVVFWVWLWSISALVERVCESSLRRWVSVWWSLVVVAPLSFSSWVRLMWAGMVWCPPWGG